jgi:hypothetical protein
MLDRSWHLADLSAELVKNDVTYFQDLMEETCPGRIYDNQMYLPALFDVERVGA